MTKFTKLSTDNPLVQILMMLIVIILFLWILRLLNTTIGFGANAHVGRLRGSFAVEGFRDSISDVMKTAEESMPEKEKSRSTKAKTVTSASTKMLS